MAMNLDGYVEKKTKIVIGKKEFTFTELSLYDLALFRSEMQEKRNKFNADRRARLIEDSKKLEGIDPMELLKFADKALTEDEIDAEMETATGLAFLAHLSLRKHHEGIELEQCQKILTTSVLDEVSIAMFPGTSEKKTKTEKPKRTHQPAK